jgi:hypothetical protein
MASEEPFSPLCDLHHSPMQHMMLEEDSEEIRAYYACERRDCTRVFRDPNGYSDRIEGQFDDSRASVRMCPLCRAVLYLASVDHFMKIETWECLRTGCDYAEAYPSPAAR